MQVTVHLAVGYGSHCSALYCYTSLPNDGRVLQPKPVHLDSAPSAHKLPHGGGCGGHEDAASCGLCLR